MSYQKLPLIIALLVLFLLAGLGAAFYFKPVKETNLETAEPIPQLAPAKLKAISSEPVLGPVLAGKTIKYYSAIDGRVWQSDWQGLNKSVLSETPLPHLAKVIWSPQTDRVISVFEQADGRIKKHIYDYSTKEAFPLNPNIEEITWSPDGQRIAYQFTNPQTEENNISIAGADGSNWQPILKTRIKKLLLDWPKPEAISLQTRPTGLAPSILYLLNPQTRQLEKIIDQTYGLTINWSPSGNKLLYSSTNERGNQLTLYFLDLKEGQPKKIPFSTFPEKCLWTSGEEEIICAVPQTGQPNRPLPCPANKTLPDDWYTGSFKTNDRLFKINLLNNEKSLLLEAADQPLDFDQLLLSPAEDYLFGVNKNDGLLYSLELPKNPQPEQAGQ